MLFPGENITQRAQESPVVGIISLVGLGITLIMGVYNIFSYGIYRGLQTALLYFSITIMVVQIVECVSGNVSIKNLFATFAGLCLYNYGLYWLGLLFTNFWGALFQGVVFFIIMAIIGKFVGDD